VKNGERGASAPRLSTASRQKLAAIVRHLQHALEMLAQRLADLLSPAIGGWPEGPGEESPIRIRDASGHGAPKWRNFS
jgi:hypothetical protein